MEHTQVNLIQLNTYELELDFAECADCVYLLHVSIRHFIVLCDRFRQESWQQNVDRFSTESRTADHNRRLPCVEANN